MRLKWAEVAALAAIAGSAFAQAPTIDDVPRDLRDPPRADFDKCHEKLVNDRDDLRARVRKHTDVTCKDVPPAGVADCAAAQASLNAEVRAYRADQDKFNDNLKAAIAASARLTELERRHATTRSALKGIAMRGGRLDQDIEQWNALDKQAREEAQRAALDVIKSHLFLNLKEHIQDKVATAVREDDRRSWIFPDFDGSPLQRIRAEGLQRLAAARTDRDIVGVLQWANNGISVALSGADAAQSRRDQQKWADFAINVGQTLLNDPLLSRITADLKAVPAMAYGIGVQYTVKQRLEEIQKLGDSQYEDAKRYSAIFSQQIEETKRQQVLPELAQRNCPRPLK